MSPKYRIVAWGGLILSSISSAASFFSISFGIMALLSMFFAAFSLFYGWRYGTRRISLVGIFVALLGCVAAGLGVVGMMGNVHRSCGDMEPGTDKQLSCFNSNYSPDWGLYHLLTN